MNDKLSLPECVLLLALNDQTGEIEKGIAPEKLNRALIAGALIELVLSERLRKLEPDAPIFTAGQIIRLMNQILGVAYPVTDHGRPKAVDDFLTFYEVVDTSPTGQRYTDRVLAKFATLTEGRRIHTLGGFASFYAAHNGRGEPPNQVVAAGVELLESGILLLEDPKGGMPWQPKPYRLPESGVFNSGEDSLRLYLVSELSENKPEGQVEVRTKALLGLVRATGLLNGLFQSRDRREKAEARILYLCEPNIRPGWIYGFADRYVTSGPSRSDILTL